MNESGIRGHAVRYAGLREKLETAGVPGPPAELQAKSLGEALSRAAASPRDLVALEDSLTANAAAVESRLNARIDALRQHVEKRIDAVEATIKALEASLDSKIDSLRAELTLRVDTVKKELTLELGGKIETLKWMFGVLVALNVGHLMRLLAIH